MDEAIAPSSGGKWDQFMNNLPRSPAHFSNSRDTRGGLLLREMATVRMYCGSKQQTRFNTKRAAFRVVVLLTRLPSLRLPRWPRAFADPGVPEGSHLPPSCLSGRESSGSSERGGGGREGLSLDRRSSQRARSPQLSRKVKALLLLLLLALLRFAPLCFASPCFSSFLSHCRTQCPLPH